jgi:hypothetical protein
MSEVNDPSVQSEEEEEAREYYAKNAIKIPEIDPDDPNDILVHCHVFNKTVKRSELYSMRFEAIHSKEPVSSSRISPFCIVL